MKKDGQRRSTTQTAVPCATDAVAQSSPQKEYPQMPCGACDAGVYSLTPALNGLQMFGECESKRAALKSAPRCKHKPSHICWGARDWISGATFPMSADERERIRAEMMR